MVTLKQGQERVERGLRGCKKQKGTTLKERNCHVVLGVFRSIRRRYAFE